MKVWTVTSSRSNESLDCEVFATEQQGLEGYLDAIGYDRAELEWQHLIELYWKDIDAFEEQTNDYIDENLPGDMYRLYEHEVAMPGVTPDPLYNEQGEQIREVTQSELDWTH